MRLPIVVSVALLTGCFGGALSAPCTSESECPFGLSCFIPAGSTGICTVGCSATSCSEGVCLNTASGPACAKSCTTAADCAGATVCTQSGPQKGCWLDGSGGMTVTEAVRVSKVEVKNASNQVVTGLKRGQTSVISVTALNGTKTSASRIRPAAACSTNCDKVSLAQCQAATITNSNACTINTASGAGARCTCDPVTASAADQYYQTLAAGAASSPPLFNIRVALAADAATSPVKFDITFTDAANKVYTDSITVEVLP